MCMMTVTLSKKNEDDFQHTGMDYRLGNLNNIFLNLNFNPFPDAKQSLYSPHKLFGHMENIAILCGNLEFWSVKSCTLITTGTMCMQMSHLGVESLSKYNLLVFFHFLFTWNFGIDNNWWISICYLSAIAVSKCLTTNPVVIRLTCSFGLEII